MNGLILLGAVYFSTKASTLSPLVDAVAAEGKRVVLWFLQEGLSDALRARADYFWDMKEVLMTRDPSLLGMILNGV